MAQFPETSLVMRREQRKYFRFPVEGEAMLFVEDGGSYLRCSMMDLGLEGCRLRREGNFTAQIGAPVEVAFRIAGAMFRFAGALKWSAKNRILGVHFTKMSEHRKQELAELLGGMREELEAREREKRAKLAEPAEEINKEINALHVVEKTPEPERTAKKSAAKRERREFDRHTVDSNARITFLSLHTRITGKVLDVSMGGCRIRSEERIPVGAFRRVEVEFMVDGLPLLLPGVTQSVHDKYTIGIRFVEMTERKRGQLQTVIEEIAQRAGAQGGD